MRNILTTKKRKVIEKTIIFFVTEYAKSGRNPKPVVLHSLRATFYLMQNGYGVQIIQAAILHDLLEDSKVGLRKIKLNFGKEIARLVKALSFRESQEEIQYQKYFNRIKKAGKSALIIKCADIYDNSFYLSLVKDKEKEIFLYQKIIYFLNLSKKIIGQEPVWQDLYQRSLEEKKRILRKYKVSILSVSI